MRRRTQDILVGSVLAGVLTLTAAAGAVIYQESKRTPPSPFAELWKPATGVFVFEPKKDMTAYELALTLQAIYGGPYSGTNLKPFYDRMPDEVKRHWRWIEPGPDSQGRLRDQPATQEAPGHPHQH